MQLRFDGTLGFHGGMIDPEETPEGAVNRELAEELGEENIKGFYPQAEKRNGCIRYCYYY